MNLMYIIGLTITGMISGLAAGLIGGGAEVLIVPLLTMFGILGSLKARIGTSLFMLLPPIGLFAAIKFYKKGYVDVPAALYLGLIFTIFASISSNYTIKLDNNLLRRIFALFMIVLGIYYYFNKNL